MNRPAERRATVEATITLLPTADVDADALEPLMEQIAARLDHALEGLCDGLPLRATLPHVGWTPPTALPVFPAELNGRVFTSLVELADAVDALRAGTPLEGPLRDAAGREFRALPALRFARG